MSSSWLECARWMNKIGFIPSSHWLFHRDAEPATLVDLLQDGYILCMLINHIDPKAIEFRAVTRNGANSEIVSVYNASIFLSSLRNYFRINPDHLFPPDSLYNRTDFDKVLKTLSELSKSEAYVSARVKSKLPAHSFDIVQGDNYIYMGIKESNKSYGQDEDIYGSFLEMDEENVYDIIFQPYSTLTMPSLEETVPSGKAGHVIREILETEKQYIDVLSALSQYQTSLTSMKIIQPAKLEKMFGGCVISELLSVHRQLYAELERQGHQQAAALGCAFLALYESLARRYCQYFLAIDDAVDTVVEASGTPAVREALETLKTAASNEQCRMFGLADILRVPGQRILKYHLLLDSLVKSTNGSATRETTAANEEALEKMRDLNLYINESKRDLEARKQIEIVMQRFIDPGLQEAREYYGKLLADGDMKVTVDNCKARFTCLLFQRALLFFPPPAPAAAAAGAAAAAAAAAVGAAVGERRRTEMKCSFSEFAVGDSPSSAGGVIILTHKKSSRTVKLHLKTNAQCQAWVKAIREASRVADQADNLGASTTHSWKLTTYKMTKCCTACGFLLKGLFCQGYRCHVCGSSVHLQCIPQLPTCQPRSGGGLPRQMSTPAAASPADSGTPSPLRARSVSNAVPPSVTEHAAGMKQRATSVHYSSLNSQDSELVTYNWFTQVVNRETAWKNLHFCPDGSFLVRRSEAQNSYALMIKHEGNVNNIKIASKGGSYSVSPKQSFRSIPELVNFFQANSLASSFPDIQTTLKIPYKEAIQKMKATEAATYQAVGQILENLPTSNGVELSPGELVKVVQLPSRPQDVCLVDCLARVDSSQQPFKLTRIQVSASKLKIL